MSYSSTQKWYILYDVHVHSFFVSRHVVFFHEHLYPFKYLKASFNPIFPVLETVVFHEHLYPFKDLKAFSNPIFPVLETVLILKV